MVLPTLSLKEKKNIKKSLSSVIENEFNIEACRKLKLGRLQITKYLHGDQWLVRVYKG